jgi:hypothetical protein
VTDSIFYDNLTVKAASTGSVAVDRVYCLQFSMFSDSDWSCLANAYELLPSWKGIEDGFPFWFGLTESTSFLTASVEPSGLQITGQVTSTELQQWHSAFLAIATILPTFKI